MQIIEKMIVFDFFQFWSFLRFIPIRMITLVILVYFCDSVIILLKKYIAISLIIWIVAMEKFQQKVSSALSHQKSSNQLNYNISSANKANDIIVIITQVNCLNGDFLQPGK